MRKREMVGVCCCSSSSRSSSSSWGALRAICFVFFYLVLYVGRCNGAAITDPVEAQALNTIFGRWGIKAAAGQWNISGDPCSGAAIDGTGFDDPDHNPLIKCDGCLSNNKTFCHITQLKVYALNVVGTIPVELQNLTHLVILKLDQNYLTGPLPEFIGNLTGMQILSVGINALSGNIPVELGNLRSLTLLGMGTNNFSGPLPSELGNLINLEQWYMDSSGVSGALPDTLSKLTNMQKLWASDNAFTGAIPEFIGSWKNLEVLRIQGNAFQGPIPSSFANLSQLEDLRIGDVTNGTSSLKFISNMILLSTLILRNCRISDTISADFSIYKSLKHLDLSFNNLTGQLPQSLFNLNSLGYLSLGNNSIYGGLPSQKSSSLIKIDLSYNQLSGSFAFPSWVNQQNLQMNLVANNFDIGDSNSSIFPPGLACLQRDVPCNRGSPVYASFAIQCGGSRDIKAFDGTIYDADKASLGAASYFVASADKWGVSNVGDFVDSPNYGYYIITNLAQYQNTLDTELFQNYRLSPSSLRYYGMGLQNGNYSIKLQFAETAFPNSLTWQSLGRRVFDIYIQGNLVEKDFNIRKEARDRSFTAVVKNYIAPVTDNFLEIHFFWAGKGTCCVPSQAYYGASVSAISVEPHDFKPNVTSPSTSKSNNTGLIAGISVGAFVLFLLAIFAILLVRRRKKKGADGDEELLGIGNKPDTFSYSELRAATGDFHPSNKVGEGGFGSVFKGKLSDGRVVAVKQLSETSRQGKRQFLTEIATISAVQHRNLVSLYGCCLEGNNRLLVYEYLENKSLDQVLFGSEKSLDWATRFEICLGTARGLAYLHEESRLRIVHRDVKASNILLDSELNPKISDFGLAKLYEDNKTHISTRVAGTIGYLAPEYALRGHLTEKADIFAFGVVALEIASGRRNSDQSLEAGKVYLLEWVWQLHEQKCEMEIIDPKLSSYDVEEARRVIGVALLCTQAAPGQRPTMSRALAMLTGDIEVSEPTSKPGYLSDLHSSEVSDTYTSSSFTGASLQVLGNTQSSLFASPSPSHTLQPNIASEGR